jgi:hypothetical protein
VGVLQINRVVGRDPGILIQTADRTWDGMNISIPAVICANTGTLSGETASQARITAFDKSWSDNSPVMRPSPFNESMVVSDVFITGNDWVKMYDDPLYQFAFHFITPAMFFFVSFQAVRFARERFVKLNKSGKLTKSPAKLFAATLTPPFMALVIEACTTAASGIFYAVDGMWANRSGPFYGGRALFFGALMMISLTTSIFVGINFADFRRAQKNMEVMGTKSFVDRHRKLLSFVAFLFIVLEVLGSVLRAHPLFTKLINMVAILSGLVVSVWFLSEAQSFSSAIGHMASTMEGASNAGMTIHSHRPRGCASI